MRNFDVLIIGSGPAGLSAASVLNKQTKLKVAVFGPHNTKSYDVKGTSAKDLALFGLESCVEQTHQNMGIYSKNEKSVVHFDKKIALVNFPKMLNVLRKRAGKSAFIKAQIIDGCRDCGGIILVDENNTEFFGKIVIDASGNSFAAAHIFNMQPPKATFHCISAICKYVKVPNQISFYMDPAICNSAFWIYPLKGKRCQIGLGEISITKTASRGNLYLSMLRAMKGISWFKSAFARAKIVSVVYGHKPVIQPAEKLYADNLILAGDSAGQGTALVGEGLRPALFGGYFAAEAAIKAFQKNSFKAKDLKLADDLWWQKFGKHEIWCQILRHLAVKHFTAEDWDVVAKRVRSIDKETFWRIMASELDFADLIQLFDFKLFEALAFDEFKSLLENAKLLSKRELTSEFL
jgi:flavin-dependent dehydrogenase